MATIRSRARRKQAEKKPTPLEQLMEMNEQAGKARRRAAKPRDPTKRVEKFYNRQLRALIDVIQQAVNEEVLPVVKQERDRYAEDSAEQGVSRMTRDALTLDTWADRILRAIGEVADRFRSSAFQSQFERLARRTVSMAEADSTDAFLRSVNEATGVDMSKVISNEGLQDYIEVATQQNAQLIRDLTDEHMDAVRNSVLQGVRGGEAPSSIARQIQQRTGVSQRRAKTLARDQTAKLTSEITERRQSQSGIRYYKSIDSGDIRVTGRPGGKYPNAKISCWGIARQDIGYGPGVYRWDEGASWGGQRGLHPGRHHINCRCTAKPVFEWELPSK